MSAPPEAAERPRRPRVASLASAAAVTLAIVAAAPLTLSGLTGCARGRPAASAGPREVLAAYAQAIEEGRLEEAYALLSEEARRELSFDDFRRMVTESPDEARALSAALVRPSGTPLVTATVTTPDGESLLLVLEDGVWKVDGSAVDLYSQATPEAAVRAFLRAYEHGRFDVLLRFVPSAQAQGLDAARLEKAWRGEQKAEMDRLTQALTAALPTARFELLGDRATMAYGAGGTVELVREDGAWKIEDFR